MEHKFITNICVDHAMVRLRDQATQENINSNILDQSSK